ncbi:MAG: class I SAM-dependent methyltransferase [Rhodanobacteraceae bacterium]
MSVRDTWQTGVQSEVDFWRSVFVGQPVPAYRQDMLDRINPDTPVVAYVSERLPKDVPTGDVKILDVAAGPVSCIGWKINGQSPQITAIDALAPQYRQLLDEFQLVPPVYTQQCDGENIQDKFSPATFDLVHIRNALDHCYDAVAVMRNMLAVLKPGGMLIVCGFKDEAEFENYNGLHQWNIRVDDGRMIIWRPDERHDINRLFADQIDALDATQNDAARWTSVMLKKK